jgi:tetratricopeptide (TPR) repeat protein
VRRLTLLATIGCCALAAQSPDRWTIAKDRNFEIYSQLSDEKARSALASFERLRIFFEQDPRLGAAFNRRGGRAVRVVLFRRGKDYDEYRPRSIADAFYVSNGTGDYIVMAALPAEAFGIAAHEYAHYVVHASGLKVPACLNEGLAEFYSTLRFNRGNYELGGDLPARTNILRGSAWLPLGDLFDFTNEPSMPDTREHAAIFYAESWALADMLIASPQYATHFRELLSEFAAGSKAAQAFRRIYGESLDDVTAELRNWAGKSHPRRSLPGQQTELQADRSYELSSFQARSLLAQVSLVSGHFEQARARYEELSREEPNDPELRAALGTIAARQGNREENLKQWRQAIRDHSTDAELCYSYALLAEDAGAGAQEVKAALQRAVALAPDFDDARYKLALTESQAGEYRLAVEQLRAMRVPAGARQYAYWVAMASALTELDERAEAKEAAQKALNAAQTEPERSQARQMSFMAATDLKVQLVTDSNGLAQMVTTRVEHGATDWNPFVEPSDNIQRANGELGEVLCVGEKLTGFLVRTAGGPVSVEVADPLHVLIRNGPKEFYCGPMQGKAVEADYAVVKRAGKTRNVLRGMAFHDATHSTPEVQ